MSRFLIAIFLLVELMHAQSPLGAEQPKVESASVMAVEGNRTSIGIKTSSSLYFYDDRAVVVFIRPRFPQITIVKNKETIELGLKVPGRGFRNVENPIPVYLKDKEVGSIAAQKEDDMRYILTIDSALFSGATHISLGSVAAIQTKAEQGGAE